MGMISILAGTDTKKRSARVKALVGKNTSLVVPPSLVSEELLVNHASSTSLFGESQAVVIEGMIGQGIVLSSEVWLQLKESPTLFIFLEDKLLVASEKKYTKYATIERFEEKKTASLPKVNTFAIADAFGRRDKIGAWMLYREAIEKGVEPEAISGILFWKIKTMLIAGAGTFLDDTLKSQSSKLVSLYHLSHRGESDFTIGLEQFILSSLSS